jgi:hypothetical protein
MNMRPKLQPVRKDAHDRKVMEQLLNLNRVRTETNSSDSKN